ncbi:helix-turn-helix transcriptional regulator [Saccharopolyspora sp. NPDC002376]
MGREQLRIKGRDDAIAVLRSALRSGAQRGRLVVVRGSAGMGKTRLLAEMGRCWRAQDVRVAEVRTGGLARQDRYGIGAVVDALRRDFDRFGDPGLIDGISALVQLRRDENARFPAAVAELNRVFGRIGRLGSTAVLLDDVLEIADPALLLTAARRPGCLLVASVRADAEPSRAAAELLEMADEVLDLAPLTAEDIDAATGGELDEGVHRALRAALGQLYGNPGTVLATLDALREQGRLTAAGTMADETSPVALPSDHDLLRRASRLGDLGARLLSAAASDDALDVDDLLSAASTSGDDPVECGRMVDRLVENGLLVADPWGQLRCACPALAAAIAAEERAPLRRLPVRRGAVPARVPSEEDSMVVPFERPALVREHGGAPRSAASHSQSWSATEERIVELISAGLTNRRIGSALGLSEKTVESHVTRLLAKSGCRSRVGLVVKANREAHLGHGAGAAFGRPAA